MIKNYFKIAWRNLVKNKVYSSINIGGLAVGMAVAMLIGLWIYDELSFNKYHQHYDFIAQVMEKDTYNGTINTGTTIPLPLDEALRKNYGDEFKHVVMSSWNEPHILAAGDKKITYPGTFIGAEAPEIFTLRMLLGTRNGLMDPSSILISQSVSTALFGSGDPMDKLVKLDNNASFKVAGVYEDLPVNTTLHDVAFMAPWSFYQASENGHRSPTDWGDNSLFMYVQVAGNTDMAKLSGKIRDIKLRNDPGNAKLKPEIFLQPMSKWHLYSEFKNGVNTGGAVQYVWLFGIIGIFVLLLACINFMNLSTARSEKRAKEVGLRKAVGSLRSQLINQFFCESLFISILAFIFSLLLTSLALPFFNAIAGKEMSILWSKPLFWIVGAGFTLVTGLIAGSYPALYLSSFEPVEVMKGILKPGRFAATPRQVLVVVQFTVSVVFIIGTIIIFKQLQFGKSRPVGYSRDGLVNIELTTNDLHNHFAAVKDDLLKSNAISGIAESSSPATGINNNRDDIQWRTKDPSLTYNFGSIRVTSDYGKTIDWQITSGRDFSGGLFTDSAAVILNEAAVKYMGLKKPVGEIIKVGKRNLSVIGVVKDMVMASPYQPIKQTVFYIGNGNFDNILVRINPSVSPHDALNKIEAVFKTYSPSVPFSYKFADDEYEKKFTNEKRIGKLTSFFAVLAIFISCLGLFGMASFMAEQRIKEIGVRKVLGASVFNLWKLLSGNFLLLVIIACVIAVPLAWYGMDQWLQNYQYRIAVNGWIFLASGGMAVLIALATVSFQAIKAAVANPVKSLKTD